MPFIQQGKSAAYWEVTLLTVPSPSGMFGRQRESPEAKDSPELLIFSFPPPGMHCPHLVLFFYCEIIPSPVTGFCYCFCLNKTMTPACLCLKLSRCFPSKLEQNMDFFFNPGLQGLISLLFPMPWNLCASCSSLFTLIISNNLS